MNRGISTKLDWNRLLGFEQVAADREAIRGSRLGSKVGTKVGGKIGVKIGVKVGLKGAA
jgi:hypothetical protein